MQFSIIIISNNFFSQHTNISDSLHLKYFSDLCKLWSWLERSWWQSGDRRHQIFLATKYFWFKLEKSWRLHTLRWCNLQWLHRWSWQIVSHWNIFHHNWFQWWGICWVYFTPPILTHLVTFLMLHASSYINMRNSTQFPVRSDLCHEQGSVQCWCHLSQFKGWWQLVINSALQWSCTNNDCSI